MADYEDKEQKTEEPTPRRLDEARDKGQVAISAELMAAIGLCVGLAVLLFGGGLLARDTGGLVGRPVTFRNNAIPIGRIYKGDSASGLMVPVSDWIEL